MDPRWAGGRPRLLSPDEEHFVIQTATTRPTKLGQPFTRRSIRILAAYLRKVHGRVIRISPEALRCLLARRGIAFQRTKTWKESPDPERDAKLDSGAAFRRGRNPAPRGPARWTCSAPRWADSPVRSRRSDRLGDSLYEYRHTTHDRHG